MYSTSAAYKEALESDVKVWKAHISVELADKTKAPLIFDDSQITDGITIESQMVSCGSSGNVIDIGAVPAKKATLTLIDDECNLHRYSGSSLAINVELGLEGGEFEEIPMGVFYPDASSLSRVGNRISIVAYDGMLSFQYVLTDAHRAALKGKTATEAAQILAAYSVCGFEQDLSGLPNANIPLNFDSPQVETGWDGIMWIAQIMGCFGRIGRENNLEFVPIMSKWTYFNEEHTLGTIHSVRDINGDQRYDDLKFADDRIHIVGVAMEGDNNMLVMRGRGGLADDANITITLEKNPIIAGCGKPLESILDDILKQLSTAYFYAFRAVIKNDPALDAGDVIRLTGGRINGTNQNNDLIGFITHSTWEYHGRQTITNVGQVPIVSADASSGNTAPDIGELAIDDVVMFTGSYHYKAAISDEGSRATPGMARISNLFPGAPHPVHLIHTNGDSNVYGWANLQDVQKILARTAARSAAPAKARAAAPVNLGTAAGFHVTPVPQSQKATKGGAATSLVFKQAPQYKLQFTNPYTIEATDGNKGLFSLDFGGGEHFAIKTKYHTFDMNANTIKVGFDDGAYIELLPSGTFMVNAKESDGRITQALSLEHDNQGGFLLKVGGHTVKTS